jgi:hypothetical protein
MDDHHFRLHKKEFQRKKKNKKPHCFQRALYFLHIVTSPNSVSHKQTKNHKLMKKKKKKKK